MGKKLNKLKNHITSNPKIEYKKENIPSLNGNSIIFFNKYIHRLATIENMKTNKYHFLVLVSVKFFKSKFKGIVKPLKMKLSVKLSVIKSLRIWNKFQGLKLLK